jgi:hypothetical protein
MGDKSKTFFGATNAAMLAEHAAKSDAAANAAAPLIDAIEILTLGNDQLVIVLTPKGSDGQVLFRFRMEPSVAYALADGLAIDAARLLPRDEGVTDDG